MVQQLGVKKEHKDEDVIKENNRLRLELSHNQIQLAEAKKEQDRQDRNIEELKKLLEEKANDQEQGE